MADGFYYRKGPYTLVPVPVASGTVIAVGDLCMISSGKATLVLSAANNLDFLGSAKSAHKATDPSTTIEVYLPGPMTVFEYPLAAATDITFGENLTWSAKQALTNSDTNPIAVALEAKLQATTIHCVFKLPAVSSSHITLISDLS